MMTFVDYATRLLKHFSVIERLHNLDATDTKVQCLVDGIKIPNNTIVGLAINHADDNLRGD